MPPLSPRAGTGRCPRRLTIILGVLEDGSREVLTVVNHPTEGALCWKDELEALRQRGVEQIDLVVSDALQGIENTRIRVKKVPLKVGNLVSFL